MSDSEAAGDDRDPAAAGVAHLQRAGREFVSAARSFLDAVEEVVEDRTRLGELAESFTGFLGELSEAARGGSNPWGSPVRPSSPAPGSGPGPDAESTGDEPTGDDTSESARDAVAAEPTAVTDSADERPQPGARVRRIPVD